jgi:hypothetical protein
VFISYYHQGLSAGVPAAAGPERFSPALKNGLLVVLFFAYAIGFSLMFERALGSLTQDNDPPQVTIVGP